MNLTLVRRLFAQGRHIGFVCIDENREEHLLTTSEIVRGAKHGKFVLMNASVGVDFSLRGKGCVLGKLPKEAHKMKEPIIYKAVNDWRCGYCLNNGVEPACSECMKANDFSGFEQDPNSIFMK